MLSFQIRLTNHTSPRAQFWFRFSLPIISLSPSRRLLICGNLFQSVDDFCPPVCNVSVTLSSLLICVANRQPCHPQFSFLSVRHPCISVFRPWLKIRPSVRSPLDFLVSSLAHSASGLSLRSIRPAKGATQNFRSCGWKLDRLASNCQYKCTRVLYVT